MLHRLDDLAKEGVVGDLSKVVLEAGGSEQTRENMQRVVVFIIEVASQDWGFDGHRDWLRSHSALDQAGRQDRIGWLAAQGENHG